MKKRRIVAGLCTLVVTAGLIAGCGGGTPAETGAVKLTLWGASEQQSMLESMIDSFKNENRDKQYDITLAVVSEADSYVTLKTDVSAGADVYGFANDQLINLNRIGALAKLGGSNLQKVKSENSEGAVSAATIGDSVYAYPYSADNGYFLYYDKSVVSKEQADSLEGILTACQSKGKKLVFDIDNSWYLGAFFFGTGCDYGVEYNEDGSKITKVECDFNDAAKGIAAGKGILALKSHSAFLNGDDTVIKAGFADGSVAAAVTGTWNASDISGYLGENYAACKLPTFKVENTTYQMGSFAGYKLYGVNPTSQNLAEAHRLAAYLSSEAMQLKRFQTFGTGPSNSNAANNDGVKANIALSALVEQSRFARAQESVPSNYWTALEAFGKDVVAGTITASNLQAKLNEMVQSIKEST